MDQTVHVFPLEGTWAVKREGLSGEVYATQRKAVAAARRSLKNSGAGQFVVHGEDGGIKEYGTYKLTPVQDPPKKKSRAAEISRAIGNIALQRVQAGSSCERTSKE